VPTRKSTAELARATHSWFELTKTVAATLGRASLAPDAAYPPHTEELA
jgi:hypothetical protein